LPLEPDQLEVYQFDEEAKSNSDSTKKQLETYLQHRINLTPAMV